MNKENHSPSNVSRKTDYHPVQKSVHMGQDKEPENLGNHGNHELGSNPSSSGSDNQEIKHLQSKYAMDEAFSKEETLAEKEICANCGHEKTRHHSDGNGTCSVRSMGRFCSCKKFIPQETLAELEKAEFTAGYIFALKEFHNITEKDLK